MISRHPSAVSSLGANSQEQLLSEPGTKIRSRLGNYDFYNIKNLVFNYLSFRI